MVNCWMKGQAGQNKCKMMVRFVNIGGNKLTMAPEKKNSHTKKEACKENIFARVLESEMLLIIFSM